MSAGFGHEYLSSNCACHHHTQAPATITSRCHAGSALEILQSLQGSSCVPQLCPERASRKVVKRKLWHSSQHYSIRKLCRMPSSAVKVAIVSATLAVVFKPSVGITLYLGTEGKRIAATPNAHSVLACTVHSMCKMQIRMCMTHARQRTAEKGELH